MSNEPHTQNDFKKIAIDNYKNYGSRVEIVSMIICGFGLYGNMKLLDLIRPKGIENSLFFVISILLFLVCVMLNLRNLILERDRRGHYMALTTDNLDAEGKQKSFDESFALEKKSKKLVNLSYILMCIAIFLPVLYIAIMMLK